MIDDEICILNKKKCVENSFLFLTEEGNFYRLDMDIERAEVLRLELIW